LHARPRTTVLASHSVDVDSRMEETYRTMSGESRKDRGALGSRSSYQSLDLADGLPFTPSHRLPVTASLARARIDGLDDFMVQDWDTVRANLYVVSTFAVRSLSCTHPSCHVCTSRPRNHPSQSQQRTPTTAHITHAHTHTHTSQLVATITQPHHQPSLNHTTNHHSTAPPTITQPHHQPSAWHKRSTLRDKLSRPPSRSNSAPPESSGGVSVGGRRQSLLAHITEEDFNDVFRTATGGNDVFSDDD
jgi:hypothetical protein